RTAEVIDPIRGCGQRFSSFLLYCLLNNQVYLLYLLKHTIMNQMLLRQSLNQVKYWLRGDGSVRFRRDSHLFFRRAVHTATLLCMLVAVSGLTLMAQELTLVQGKVTDIQGAPIAGASV